PRPPERPGPPPCFSRRLTVSASQTAMSPSSKVTDTGPGPGEMMSMRVFVAGGTGALGRRLVPRLVERGHEVTATTTGEAKLGLVSEMGAEGVVLDGLVAGSVAQAADRG